MKIKWECDAGFPFKGTVIIREGCVTGTDQESLRMAVFHMIKRHIHVGIDVNDRDNIAMTSQLEDAIDGRR